MADEFDEYEKILEAGGAPPAPPPAADGDLPGAAEAAGGDRRGDKRSSDRHKSERRSRDRSGGSRERSRERRRSERRERDNDFKGGDGGSRRRRSRSPRPGDKERDSSRRHRDERERGRDAQAGRGSDRGRYGARRRSPTPPEVRAQRERERELKELERATRTVFAYNINVKADERDIYEFFTKAGEVTDIRIITDRHTKRSKGLAYIEFGKQEEVFAALTLTGQTMLGQPVMVKPAEAEKNLAWEAAQAAKAAAPPDADLLALGLGGPGDPFAALGLAGVGVLPEGPLQLQVTGFKEGLGESEIRQIFEPFGALDSCSVVRDGAGQPASIAYVTFSNAADGRNAMQHWHGTSLLDHKLSVVAVGDAGGDAAAAAMLGAGGGGPGPAIGVGELDEGDGGLRIDAQGRAALMSRLAAGAGIQAPLLPGPPGAAPYAVPGAGAPNPLAAVAAAAAVGGILPGGLLAAPAAAAVAAAAPGPDLSLQQGLCGPASPIATPCLLLKGMFSAETQADPDWVSELTEDVTDECSKFGAIAHLHIDTTSQGFVYLKFDSTGAAQAAAKVLHGRFYNGAMIQAEFQFEKVYNQVFSL